MRVAAEGAVDGDADQEQHNPGTVEGARQVRAAQCTCPPTQRRQEERLLHLEDETRVLKQKNNDLETFSRERSHALTHKNIRIAQLQTELEECVAQEAGKWRAEVQA